MNDQPTSLWTLRQDGRWVECVTRLVPDGIQVETLMDGTPMYSRILPTSEAALAFAEGEPLRQ